jgi:hypothetical protein
LLRNAPVMNEKAKAQNKDFKILQDNFIASYNPDDGSFDIYPFKSSKFNRIIVGNNWCH